ncbi:glycosyltransferase family 4 protein [bacterium]|nr:glycosyltransferase family 4 protein [bacterium]
MYPDLMEELKKHGHEITVIAPSVNSATTTLQTEHRFQVLRVKSIPIVGVHNLIKKGIGMALLPHFFKKAYKKYLNNQKFDWIFLPTPPITLIDFVSYIKQISGAKFYLILRDIHPQSAASIGLIKHKFMYDYLAKRAKIGYTIADKIGCMSQGNIDFIAANYPELNRQKLVLLMNWQKNGKYSEPQENIREKYNLQDKILALFGGNIGYGQRIENIHFLAKHYKDRSDVVFLVVGKGVKKAALQKMIEDDNLKNVIFFNFLPRDEYLDFIKSVDIGLISISEKYTVPTCPSKAVSYMSLKIPIMAMINYGNDYGTIIENAGAGFWTEGDKKDKIVALFDKLLGSSELRKKMGENGYKFYLENLTSEHAYNAVIKEIEDEKA